ncbi:MAG: flagellar assembly protein FliW [bacterium]
MKIDSKPYGEIEVDSSKIVNIEGGLFGFEDHEEFVIIGKKEEQPFEWLQAVDDSTLAFVMVQPLVVRPNYELSLLQEDLYSIGAESTDDIIPYLLLVVPDDPQEMTANLKGPVIINQENLQGKQVINQIDEYGVRHKVLQEMEESGSDILSGSETS